MKLFAFIAGILMFCSFGSYGQSLDLQFSPNTDCDQLEFCVDLQIRVQEEDQTSNLGSSSILFHYDTLALDYKEYNSLNFDGSDECLLGLFSVWEEHGTDGESIGTFNITLNLGVSLQEEDAINSCPTITNEWENIGQVCFDITGSSESDTLLWFSKEPNLISFNNYNPNDGSNQIAEGTFTDLLLDLECNTEAPPQSHFTASNQNGYAPFSVDFDANSSYDNDGTIADYAWDFGDGQSSNGITTSHIFEEVGTYTVILTVTDNDGLTNISEEIIEVQTPPLNPEAVFTMMNTPEGAAPFTVMLSGGDSSDEDGLVVSYFWDFGDGESAFGLNAIHTYPMPGEYDVTLTVTDSQGLTDTYTETITVTDGEAPPQANIASSVTSGSPPLEIDFDGSGSVDSNGELVDYHWFFGDGTEDLGAQTMYTYTEAGSYTVTLVVTDDEGLMAMATETITVIPPSGNVDDLGIPQAIISAEDYETSLPTNVILSGNNSTDAVGEIIAYEWMVNGLLLSNTAEFDLYVIAPDTYEVVLTVFDDDGQTSSDTLNIEFEDIGGNGGNGGNGETCEDIIQQAENQTYMGSICAGNPVNLAAIWELDADNIQWVNENGIPISNPSNYVIDNWNCNIEQAQLTSTYIVLNETTCIETTYYGTHTLTVYPEVIATVQSLENSCGVELTTCPGYEVTWNDGVETQEGNIYTNEAPSGQVEFTVTNPLAPESCNTKTFQGFYYCAIDLELTLSTTETMIWGIGQKIPVELRIENKGIIPANNVRIQQVFSKMVEITETSPSNNYNTSEALWVIPKLEPTQSVDLSFTLTPEEEGDLEIAAWVEWADENDLDSYPGNTNYEEDDYAAHVVLVSNSASLACDEVCAEIITCTPALTPLTICPDYCVVEGDVIIEEYISIFNCSLTQLESGCFEYMPLPGMDEATNPDQLTVVASDGENCETLMYEITIGDCNGNPVGVNDYVVTPKDTPINIYALSNDTDPEEDLLQICDIIVEPSYGTVSIVPEGLNYAPNPGFVGSDVMAYEVCDGSGGISIAFAYVLVHESGECVNDIIYACVSPGEVVTFCPVFCSFSNTEAFESLSVTEGGLILDLENSCFRYRPRIDFEGFEEIVATACFETEEGEVAFCETVRYVVTVNDVCLPNASNLPYLVDDYDTTKANTTVIIDVIPNDNVPLGVEVELCDVGDPFYGTAVITEDGKIAYTPNEDYIGNEIFGYTVCDANNNTGYAFVLVHVTEGDPCDIDMSVCTAPLQAVDICLELCGPDYEIVDYHTTFDCGISMLSESCVRYQPLPGFIGTDTVHINYCDLEGDCLSATIDVIISPNCEDFAEETVNNIRATDEQCEIPLANVLTPNNDGINDVLYIGESEACYLGQEMTLRIFDRYGNTVYETQETIEENNQLWDGSHFNGGTKVPSGVYYYHLQLNNDISLTSRTGFLEVRF